MTKGKLKIEDRDGNGSFCLAGRVMWDYIDTDEDGSGADDFRGTELRRARLGFEGEVYDWRYKFDGESVGGGASVKDAWIKYGTKVGDTSVGLKLGTSHIQYGLNTKMSSKYMTFIDRPQFADSSISPALESGAVLTLAAPDYTWILSSGYTV